MAKMSGDDRAFMSLIDRSPDIGDGWRKVSPYIWSFVTNFSHQELLEVDETFMHVRLSERGKLILEYL